MSTTTGCTRDASPWRSGPGGVRFCRVLEMETRSFVGQINPRLAEMAGYAIFIIVETLKIVKHRYISIYYTQYCTTYATCKCGKRSADRGSSRGSSKKNVSRDSGAGSGVWSSHIFLQDTTRGSRCPEDRISARAAERWPPRKRGLLVRI